MSDRYGTFDPSGPTLRDTLFGLPHDPEAARVLVLPVPFEATASYRRGTAGAPEAILQASQQVDLWDAETGTPWREGIALVDPVGAREDGPACLDAARARVYEPGARDRVDAACAEVVTQVEAWTEARLAEDRIPAILGGEHSVALGAMRAAARRHPGLGILHIDAHADLRKAYEGFTHSHASVLFNLLESTDEVGLVVQLPVRDQCEEEVLRANKDGRVVQWFDTSLAEALANGVEWGLLVEEILAPLPVDVWVTFDIDGLDPTLCPGTGTPVPGGLSWREATTLLAALARSGRRIVGFDLCEVGAGEWDANVGARLLYKLAGWALFSRGAARARP